MEKASFIRALAASTSLVTLMGSDTTTRGAGRPAASAAAVMAGAMWPSMVAVPVIQVTVPSATRPANLSMVSPSAATSTGGASTPEMSSGANALVVRRSPSTRTVSPCSSGIREARYSFM